MKKDKIHQNETKLMVIRIDMSTGEPYVEESDTFFHIINDNLNPEQKYVLDVQRKRQEMELNLEIQKRINQ